MRMNLASAILHTRPLPLLWIVAVLTFTAACGETAVATPRPVVVVIAGATSMHPVLQDLATEFTQRHPNVLIELRGGGSTLGETRVRERRLALAASTLMDEEVNDSDSGPAGEKVPLLRAPIGIDSVAVIVHESNPVTGFTSEQLRDVFGGRILDWGELQSDPGEIVLVSREDGSGTRRAFESRIMDEKPVSLTAVVMPTSRDVVGYVSRNPFAIGYVSSAYVTGRAAQSQPDSFVTPGPERPSVRAVAVDGVLPSDETISDQSYPLLQPLYLVSRKDPQTWVRQFIDFALSPAGQAIVDRYHVPVR
jgi:phosphate transport system substrate-binding protein